MFFGIVSGNYFVEIKGQVFTVQNNTFPLVNEIWFRATGGTEKLVINSYRVWCPLYIYEMMEFTYKHYFAC